MPFQMLPLGHIDISLSSRVNFNRDFKHREIQINLSLEIQHNRQYESYPDATETVTMMGV